MTKVAFSKLPDGGVGYGLVPDDYTPRAGEVVRDLDGLGDNPRRWAAARVWDETSSSPRPPTDAELLAAAKTQQEALVRDSANNESLREVRPFEARIAVAKWARQLALSAEEQSIFNAENARYNKLVGLVSQIRAATTISQVQGITW